MQFVQLDGEASEREGMCARITSSRLNASSVLGEGARSVCPAGVWVCLCSTAALCLSVFM